MNRQLDLGCGNTPRGREGYEVFGVDIADTDLPNVEQADLAIDSIPFNENEFDLVTAHDFMEHIPQMVYLTEFDGLDTSLYKHDCMIELFNEIFRVLKPNGEFFMASPMVGSAEYWRDPTHCFPWHEQTIHYFSGDYFGMHDLYGHTSKFELVDKKVIDGWRLEIRLRAIKPCVPPYLVGSIT